MKERALHILIVDDDVALCRSLQIQIEAEGHSVECIHLGKDAIERLDRICPDLAFVDLQLPDVSGMQVLRKIGDACPDTAAVMITGVQDAAATIEAVRTGAYDYIRKPLDIDAILQICAKVERDRSPKPPALVSTIAPSDVQPHEIVGADPKIIEILKQIAQLAENQLPVLVWGESGTGKELVARTIHEARDPGHPFVAVNCSAVVPTLLESELFGHVKGAFTGADTTKSGKMEAAGIGTLFLDEIGDMALDLQAKLLRVLQEREFEPVGSTKSSPFRARVLAATNRDLAAMVVAGKFREDLYYRLAVTTIRIPPLRERRGDIQLLVDRIINTLNRDLDRRIAAIEETALRRLEAYDWPGNVRELVNVLTRSVLRVRGETLTADALDGALGDTLRVVPGTDPVPTLREVERAHIEKALFATGWNIKKTAELLDITRVTLRKKIADFGLGNPRDATK